MNRRSRRQTRSRRVVPYSAWPAVANRTRHLERAIAKNRVGTIAWRGACMALSFQQATVAARVLTTTWAKIARHFPSPNGDSDE